MLPSGLSQEAAASAREEAEDLKEKLKGAQAKQLGPFFGRELCELCVRGGVGLTQAVSMAFSPYGLEYTEHASVYLALAFIV